MFTFLGLCLVPIPFPAISQGSLSRHDALLLGLRIAVLCRRLPLLLDLDFLHHLLMFFLFLLLPLLLEGLLEVGTGRKFPDLALVGRGGAGDRTLRDRQVAKSSHGLAVAVVDVDPCLALPALLEDALVAEPELAVLRPGLAALAAYLPKAQGLRKASGTEDLFVRRRERGRRWRRTVVMVMGRRRTRLLWVRWGRSRIWRISRRRGSRRRHGVAAIVTAVSAVMMVAMFIRVIGQRWRRPSTSRDCWRWPAGITI